MTRLSEFTNLFEVQDEFELVKARELVLFFEKADLNLTTSAGLQALHNYLDNL